MATIKSQYGLSNQSISVTIAGLANNGQRSSAAVDNTSSLYLDCLIQVLVKSGASGTSATGYVNVYVYGTADGGSHYADGVAGSDAGVTLSVNPPVFVTSINVTANATTYLSRLISLAAVFGGVVPDHWGIVIENKSGATLDGSVGSAWYQGLWNQAA